MITVPLHAEQRRAADLLVVEDLPDPADARAHQQVREAAPQRAAELGAPQVEDERREALEELDHDVAERPRRRRRRRPGGGSGPCPRRCRRTAGRTRRAAPSRAGSAASPLPFSSPIDSSATRGLGDAQDALREDRAHPGVLGEVLGRRVGVGADVEEHERPASVTIWTASAGRSTPGSRPSRRTAAAIPAPVWPAVTTASASPSLDEVRRDEDRGVLLLAQGERRVLVHPDDLAGMHDRDVRRQRRRRSRGSSRSSPTRMTWSSGWRARGRGRRGRPRPGRGRRPSRRPRCGPRRPRCRAVWGRARSPRQDAASSAGARA